MVIDKRKFANIFKEAKSRYKELQNVDVELKFGKGWFFTMRASLKLKSIFLQKRKYFVQVNSDRKDILSKLSNDDIIGWFGHELAHVIEYEKLSNFQLFLFILRYVFDVKFRFFIEKRINVFAFNNGFAQELFGVFKKFLSMNITDAKYKNYIIENYCPTWEDIKIVAEKHGINKNIY